MTLLWITGAWHDTRPGDDEWDEYGYGYETMPERRERYIRRVQDVHGVDRDTALGAIKAVVGHLRDKPVQPFASVPSPIRRRRLPEEVDFKEAWDNAPVEDVDLHQPVHASQHWLKGKMLAHNLFHPGEVPAEYDERVGHPDEEPNRNPDSEDYEYYTENDNGPRDLPRLIRQTDGSYVIGDGHHRMATELLLNKHTTKARVLDIRHLSGRSAPP